MNLVFALQGETLTEVCRSAGPITLCKRLPDLFRVYIYIGENRSHDVNYKSSNQTKNTSVYYQIQVQSQSSI